MNVQETLGILNLWKEAQWIRPLDLAFARFLHRQDPENSLLPLAAALVSMLEGQGHVCMDLPLFLSDPLTFWELGSHQGGFPHPGQLEPFTLPPEGWVSQLLSSPVVACSTEISTCTGAPPLVLEGQRLYLRRHAVDEWDIARCLLNLATGPILDCRLSGTELERKFPEQEPGSTDWQKLAVAMALDRQLLIVTGGPGTGKTYTLTRFLGLLLSSQPETRVRLAAPTGKAAARINESLGMWVQAQEIPDITGQLPTAVTLHRLLGARSDTRRYAYDARHPLDLDLLIVDEASMIQQELMAALLRALPPRARLVLLGDPDQLASVEAGAVLAEICRRAPGYSPTQADRLLEHWGIVLPEDRISPRAAAFDDSHARLEKKHRFGGSIGDLAEAIQKADPAAAEILLCCPESQPFLKWHSIPDQRLVLAAVDHAFSSYWKKVQKVPSKLAEPAFEIIRELFEESAKFRLLCALRHGEWGSQGINLLLENYWRQNGQISSGPWYPGRLVLMERNRPDLKIHNGDLGIFLPDSMGKMRVYFPIREEQKPHSVSPARLGECRSAYAMTVHKAQGSEFSQVMLLLPPDDTPLLCRELLYTAVTRAKEHFAVFATAGILRTSILRQTHRMSGLGVRLENLSVPVSHLPGGIS